MLELELVKLFWLLVLAGVALRFGWEMMPHILEFFETLCTWFLIGLFVVYHKLTGQMLGLSFTAACRLVNTIRVRNRQAFSPPPTGGVVWYNNFIDPQVWDERAKQRYSDWLNTLPADHPSKRNPEPWNNTYAR